MSHVIERLRASKEEFDKEMDRLGNEAGRSWAEHRASYADLFRVSKITDYRGPLDELRKAVDPDGVLDDSDFWRALGLDEEANADAGDAFFGAFISGAKDVFSEVKDKI